MNENEEGQRFAEALKELDRAIEEGRETGKAEAEARLLLMQTAA